MPGSIVMVFLTVPAEARAPALAALGAAETGYDDVTATTAVAFVESGGTQLEDRDLLLVSARSDQAPTAHLAEHFWRRPCSATACRPSSTWSPTPSPPRRHPRPRLRCPAPLTERACYRAVPGGPASMPPGPLSRMRPPLLHGASIVGIPRRVSDMPLMRSKAFAPMLRWDHAGRRSLSWNDTTRSLPEP